LVDLQTQFQSISQDVTRGVQDVLRKGNFILGEEVEQFERKFADYCEADHAIGVASGTDALYLALRALDVGPGDEVITVANTFVATGFSILYAGAEPVFVDCSPEDYTIDPYLIESAITPRTKAILPVHLYGQPARMEVIREIARSYNLHVVEDACQAHGARENGRRVGALGELGCFSFYPGKNLGAYGDGGAIVTNDESLAQRVRLLRNYGQVKKNVHAMVGYNSRLDTIQAAVLLAKLGHLDAWNEQRRVAAGHYDELLGAIGIETPQTRDDVDHVFHLYVIKHEARDQLIEHLSERQVFAGIHYPTPLPLMEPFREARRVPEDLPVSSELAGQILSLPIYPEITREQIEHVVEGVKSFAATAVDA